MRIVIIYGGLIWGLGVLHLQALLASFISDIPIYYAVIVVGGFVIYFSRRQPLQISVIGLRLNSMLFMIQIALFYMYTVLEPSWFYLFPALIFLAIEYERILLGRRLTLMDSQLEQYEEQKNQLNETFKTVRGERHDFLKHVSAIHFLLEKRKFDEAKDYLDELVEGYEETNLAIKGERGTVAGILHQMYKRAKKAGISIVYDIDLPVSSLPMTDHHLVTLLGNLLSNSIEACVEWQIHNNKQASITLQFYKRGGLYILICKNDSMKIPTEVLDELFKSYGNTTKAGEHEGLGTKLIHDVVEEYQGFLDFVYKNEEFMIKIKIPSIH
ncbi:sensor histidine kinase [Bacillus salitolerans]|uniref:Sensor histidine kinase n=1 Tax=Bacillus salitolerans TaxID=1437434 RepID=A0ABW4LRX6_9BACI